MTVYTKYPRTPHLPWSRGISDDDKMIKSTDHFQNKYVVVTSKMDGENTTMYRDHIHARSLDSRGGVDRDWVKRFWATIKDDIPEGYRICGENLWAKHSIYYTDLKSYFYGFSVWDENNICLSWKETLEWFQLLGITPVPTIYKGLWNSKVIRDIQDEMDFEFNEGYVVRLQDSFHFDEFDKSIAKFVRKNHVQTDEHWRHSNNFMPNKLIC